MKKVVPFHIASESKIYPQLDSKHRLQKNYRRAASSLIGSNHKFLHKSSQSTHIPEQLIEEDPREEIEMIKEELQARYEQQKQREEMFNSLFPSDNESALVTDEIYVECVEVTKDNITKDEIKTEEPKSQFFCCKEFFKCLFV